MKVLVILCFLFLSVNLYSHDKGREVHVSYVSFVIETPFSIDCHEFDSFFAKESKHYIIIDSTFISLVLSDVRDITAIYKNSNTPKIASPDTRVKIRIYENKVLTQMEKH